MQHANISGPGPPRQVPHVLPDVRCLTSPNPQGTSKTLILSRPIPTASDLLVDLSQTDIPPTARSPRERRNSTLVFVDHMYATHSRRLVPTSATFALSSMAGVKTRSEYMTGSSASASLGRSFCLAVGLRLELALAFSAVLRGLGRRCPVALSPFLLIARWRFAQPCRTMLRQLHTLHFVSQVYPYVCGVWRSVHPSSRQVPLRSLH